MNILDVIIVIFIISAVFRGAEIGFVRQLFSTAGFFGGLWLGALIEPHIGRLAHTTLSRTILAVATTLGTAFIFLGLGEYAGFVAKHKLSRFKVNVADNFLGSLISIVTVLIAAWISASVLAPLPFPGIQSAIRNSAIIATLNKSLPPAPTVVTDIGYLIDPNGFPKVFTGNEPAPPSNVSAPSLDSLQPVVSKDRASVVKIEGQGCGGIVEGSGFVVAPGLVATNAHVVAGIDSPYVMDSNGTHQATPIWFDPDLDFAVLRVSDLAGKPLNIDSSTVAKSTPGAVLGYPGGGDFTADAAVVLDEFTAEGRNIYNQGNTKRDVYEIHADVIPGNSGGPLIDKNGTVIGVVFAQSTTYSHTGYTLTTPEVLNEIHQAETSKQPTSTGSCAE